MLCSSLSVCLHMYVNFSTCLCAKFESLLFFISASLSAGLYAGVRICVSVCVGYSSLVMFDTLLMSVM